MFYLYFMFPTTTMRPSTLWEIWSPITIPHALKSEKNGISGLQSEEKVRVRETIQNINYAD